MTYSSHWVVHCRAMILRLSGALDMPRPAANDALKSDAATAIFFEEAARR